MFVSKRLDTLGVHLFCLQRLGIFAEVSAFGIVRCSGVICLSERPVVCECAYIKRILNSLFYRSDVQKEMFQFPGLQC